MQGIVDFIEELETYPLARFATGILIIVAFWMLSSGIAFLLVKTVKIGVKDPKKIKKSAFYNPLKLFFKIFGIYLAILFTKDIYNLQESVIQIVNKTFKIITTIVFARGLAMTFSQKATIAKKIRNRKSRKVDEGMLNMALRVIRCIIYIGATIIIITELGYNINSLLAGLGVGGIIVTLAAQDTAKNLLGGVMLLLDKPFVVGDWIQMGTIEGTVEEMTFRCTRVRTFENSIVNVPNSIISNSSVENWSRMEQRRYRTRLYLDINTPLEKVQTLMEKIKKILLNHEQIDDDTIIIGFEEIIDNAIEIMISSFTESIDYKMYLKERERINYKIMQIVREENIKLAENAEIVHIKN